MIDFSMRPISGVFLRVAVMPLFRCGSCGLHGIKLTGSKRHRCFLLRDQLRAGTGSSRPHSCQNFFLQLVLTGAVLDTASDDVRDLLLGGGLDAHDPLTAVHPGL